MTYEAFNTCLQEVEAYSESDAYASDVVLSMVDRGEIDEKDLERAAEALRRLHEYSSMPIGEIRRRTNMTQRAFASRFGISQRTIESWECGRRACPTYLKMLMIEVLGLFDRHELVDERAEAEK